MRKFLILGLVLSVTLIASPAGRTGHGFELCAELLPLEFGHQS
jgi:hypothetical protein